MSQGTRLHPLQTAQAIPVKGRSVLTRSLRNDFGALLALLVLGLIIALALLAPLVTPFDPSQQQLNMRLRPPTWWFNRGAHAFGTDQLGRDILTRIIFGARVSLSVAGAAVVFSGLLGTWLGIMAGYYGGLIDELIMRVADVELSIPFILLAIALMAIFGISLRNLIIVLVIQGWVVYARLVRGQVLSLREAEYVTALRAFGASGLRIMMRHLLPNLAASVTVVATLETANMIIIAAGLSFLGLGVNPLTPDWGAMLGDGRDYVASAWWLATFPGLAISITVLSVNVLGDALRDRFDPRLRT
jgi:peptide/nickel transport system permease protein